MISYSFKCIYFLPFPSVEVFGSVSFIICRRPWLKIQVNKHVGINLVILRKVSELWFVNSYSGKVWLPRGREVIAVSPTVLVALRVVCAGAPCGDRGT